MAVTREAGVRRPVNADTWLLGLIFTKSCTGRPKLGLYSLTTSDLHHAVVCSCCINQVAAAVLVSVANRPRAWSTRVIDKPDNVFETAMDS